MLHGRIVAESLRPGTDLSVPGLGLSRVSRVNVTAGPGQPDVWTLIDVVAPGAGGGPLLCGPTGGRQGRRAALRASSRS
jgi:hypothetical protein